MSRFDPYRDTPKAGDYSKNREVLAAGIMTDCAQILDVVKREWGSSWSGWDQDVRDRMTAWLQEHYQGFPHQPTGAKPGRAVLCGRASTKGHQMNRDREAIDAALRIWFDGKLPEDYQLGRDADEWCAHTREKMSRVLALPVGGGVEDGMTREEVIAGMAVELDRCPGFFRDLGTGDRTVKACVWAARLFDAALSPTTLGGE